MKCSEDHHGCCSPSLWFSLLLCFQFLLLPSHMQSQQGHYNMRPVFKRCADGLYTPLNAFTASSFFPAKQTDDIKCLINVLCFFWMSSNNLFPEQNIIFSPSPLCSVAFLSEPNMKIRFPVTTLFASNVRREQQSLGTVNGKTWRRSPGWQPGTTKIIILNSQWDRTPHGFLSLIDKLPSSLFFSLPCFYTTWTLDIKKINKFV